MAIRVRSPCTCELRNYVGLHWLSEPAGSGAQVGMRSFNKWRIGSSHVHVTALCLFSEIAVLVSTPI